MQIERNGKVEPSVGFIPGRIYTCLIKEVSNAPAATGTAQTRLRMEIISPAEVEQGGEVFKTAGQVFDMKAYFTEKSMKRTLTDLEVFGLKTLETAESTEEVQAELSGLLNHFVDVYASNQQRFKRVALSPAEIAKGKKSYDSPIFKDDNGQPIADGYEFSVKLTDVRAGTVKTDVGDPY